MWARWWEPPTRRREKHCENHAQDVYSGARLRGAGRRGKDLVHFFNDDGLGAIINSSRGIIAAYKQEAYKKFGPENFAEASRQAVKDMIADIDGALQAAK